MQRNYSQSMTWEPFKNDVTDVGERGLSKISNRRWHSGEEVDANSDITTKKKLCISFYFSLVFGQRSSNWALVSIPVVVSFQALAWVCARRLNSSTKIWYSNLVVSTQIHTNKDDKNKFYRFLNMLLVH